DRRAQPQKDAIQAPAAAALADQRRLPAGVHLGRERQQGLLRARAPGPLPARIRETAMNRIMNKPKRRMSHRQALGEHRETSSAPPLLSRSTMAAPSTPRC